MFEDYKPLSYWEELIRSSGFKVILSKKIKQKSKIPFNILEEIVQNTIKEWRKLTVDERFIVKLCALLN